MKENLLYKNFGLRNSSIELLKIIAIFLIVISHSVPIAITLTPGMWSVNAFQPLEPNFNFFNSLLVNFGQIGNIIFVICSSFFLCKTEIGKIKISKICSFIIDLLFFSLLFLFFFSQILHFSIPKTVIIQQFFPFTFRFYWFINCYVIFYMLSPFLNIIVNYINKKALFTFNAITIFLYYILAFFIGANKFFYNELIGFIVIYFIVAYVKKYLVNTAKSFTFNIILIAFGLIIWGALEYISIAILKTNLIYINRMNNPAFLLISLGLFNIFCQFDFKNKFINYISSLSFLIYIIHANRLLRYEARDSIYSYFYNTYIYKEHMFIFIMASAVVLYLSSVLLASIYKCSIQKLFLILSDKLEQKIVYLYHKLSSMLTKYN